MVISSILAQQAKHECLKYIDLVRAKNTACSFSCTRGLVRVNWPVLVGGSACPVSVQNKFAYRLTGKSGVLVTQTTGRFRAFVSYCHADKSAANWLYFHSSLQTAAYGIQSKITGHIVRQNTYILAILADDVGF